jgi:D-alanine-D-alanine ligase
MKRFTRVAVLKGGPTSERDVSLRSGAAIANGLRAKGYDTREIDVVDESVRLPDGIEAVFIALHGRFGEDGGVQQILRDRGIPYTGSDPASSRLSMDKKLTREVLRRAGVPVAEGVALSAYVPRSPLPLPVVVKPTREGSSVGCHRVFRHASWSGALRDALSYNGEAVCERYIRGRELTVGIVGDEALPVVEIRPRGGYYDYRSKYTRGMSEYLVPAPLDEATADEARRLARETFRALGCRGFARVDFRMGGDGRLYVLELNSIPGFTETSLLPKAAAAAGLAFPDLCERILDGAAL